MGRASTGPSERTRESTHLQPTNKRKTKQKAIEQESHAADTLHSYPFEGTMCIFILLEGVKRLLSV